MLRHSCTKDMRSPGAGTGNVHRADFLDGTIKLIKSECAKFNHVCTTYTPHENGITLHFENQEDQEADILIATDGVKSRIRRHLYTRKNLSLESQTAKYAEWIAWRGNDD
jgi:salicylate hydroxylase